MLSALYAFPVKPSLPPGATTSTTPARMRHTAPPARRGSTISSCARGEQRLPAVAQTLQHPLQHRRRPARRRHRQRPPCGRAPRASRRTTAIAASFSAVASSFPCPAESMSRAGAPCTVSWRSWRCGPTCGVSACALRRRDAASVAAQASRQGRGFCDRDAIRRNYTADRGAKATSRAAPSSPARCRSRPAIAASRRRTIARAEDGEIVLERRRTPPSRPPAPAAARCAAAAPGGSAAAPAAPPGGAGSTGGRGSGGGPQARPRPAGGRGPRARPPGKRSRYSAAPSRRAPRNSVRDERAPAPRRPGASSTAVPPRSTVPASVNPRAPRCTHAVERAGAERRQVAEHRDRLEEVASCRSRWGRPPP